jgi:hypothetical protein
MDMGMATRMRPALRLAAFYRRSRVAVFLCGGADRPINPGRHLRGQIAIGKHLSPYYGSKKSELHRFVTDVLRLTPSNPLQLSADESYWTKAILQLSRASWRR